MARRDARPGTGAARPDEQVLAEFLAAAGAGTGADTPSGCSLYDLWSATTALTQEVKLQGRTFRQLTDAVAPIAELDHDVHAVLDAHAEAMTVASRLSGEVDAARAERQRQAIGEAEQRAAKTALEALLDARDRLTLGLRTAEATAPQPLGRLAALLAPGAGRAIEAAAALRQGYEMALARLDEGLHAYGVREIKAVGATFDPRRMRAAEAVATTAAPAGTVIEVLRCGYESDAGVVRVAEVRVARAP